MNVNQTYMWWSFHNVHKYPSYVVHLKLIWCYVNSISIFFKRKNMKRRRHVVDSHFRLPGKPLLLRALIPITWPHQISLPPEGPTFYYHHIEGQDLNIWIWGVHKYSVHNLRFPQGSDIEVATKNKWKRTRWRYGK